MIDQPGTVEQEAAPNSYRPVGDPMGVWNHPMHDLQARLEICAGSVEFNQEVAANMRRQRNDLRAFLELWTHESRLQTFENREQFRKAARELLDDPLGTRAARPTP